MTTASLASAVHSGGGGSTRAGAAEGSTHTVSETADICGVDSDPLTVTLREPIEALMDEGEGPATLCSSGI